MGDPIRKTIYFKTQPLWVFFSPNLRRVNSQKQDVQWISFGLNVFKKTSIQMRNIIKQRSNVHTILIFDYWNLILRCLIFSRTCTFNALKIILFSCRTMPMMVLIITDAKTITRIVLRSFEVSRYYTLIILFSAPFQFLNDLSIFFCNLWYINIMFLFGEKKSESSIPICSSVFFRICEGKLQRLSLEKIIPIQLPHQFIYNK